MTKAISRRGFLTGAGAVGLGIAGATVAGMGNGIALAEETTGAATAQPQITAAAVQSPVMVEAGATPGATDTTYGYLVNPQEDFSTATTDYSAIFSPLKIGSSTMKNRLGKSCAGSETQHSALEVSDSAMGFYERFCKGGLGLICVEPGEPFSGRDKMPLPPGTYKIDIDTDEGIERVRPLAEMAHNYGALIIAQMLDMFLPWGGASTVAVPSKLETVFQRTDLMQTTEDVHREQQVFIDAAVRYWKAGFDGVEINASCNHYFACYLSRYTNRERTDQYSGASIENRCRIVTEIIEGIRKQCGEDFLIEVLYSGIEADLEYLGKDELCTTVDEACEMGRLFEKAGANFLQIRSQLYGNHASGFLPDVLHYCEHGDTGYGTVIDYRRHLEGIVVGQHEGYAGLLEVAAKIKQAVSIPVGTVGAMDPRATPDLLDNAIKDGKIDFMMMNRPLMADGLYAAKLQAGRRDEIAPCVHCLTCFVAPFGLGMPEYCRVNAALTNAYSEDMPEGYDPLPALGHEYVMVVGAGPGGMECARVAAQRGHSVTLYEKEDDVGGMMNFTMGVKAPHERIVDHKNYLKRQLEVWGVTLVKNKEVTLDFIREEQPSAVVFATGSLYDTLPFSASGNIISIEDFYKGRASIDDMPENVVVYGAQLYAADLAKYFLRSGKKVTILNPGPADELLKGAPVWPGKMGSEWLPVKSTKIYNNVVVARAEGGTVTFDTDYGTSVSLEYDVFVNGMPLMPNMTMYDALNELAAAAADEDPATAWMPAVYVVGNAQQASTITHAITSGNLTAREIGGLSIETEEPLAANQYRGSALAFGTVSVTLTVEGKVITAVVVNTRHETAGIARHLGDQFAAEIMAKGSVDAVSGATITSDAVREALAEAKQQAGI
ncbi:MAG: FAD-dependent oxidoreductase [Coriobacteriales bacterium]|jgi:2,4-dienoyl-CoA reductase-like NADH-dependent reductase (Old Yellow Enzyme family)/pyruvate/2-oxoglutarate dehydrogenase complex dihydrolipoamide dehydrogenase (E3) component|nr:FAD-dependent oxidoreductase [Coriobacteriales bacterium]